MLMIEYFRKDIIKYAIQKENRAKLFILQAGKDNRRGNNNMHKKRYKRSLGELQEICLRSPQARPCRSSKTADSGNKGRRLCHIAIMIIDIWEQYIPCNAT